MQKSSPKIVYSVAACAAFGAPVLLFCLGFLELSCAAAALFLFNLAGWVACVVLFRSREAVRDYVICLADVTRVRLSNQSLEGVTESLVKEMKRRDDALSVDLGQFPIQSRKDLSRALQYIASNVMNTLSAEAVELALYDKESGLYHSAFLLGTPSQPSTQAMLWGASDDSEELPAINVIVQPIEFAGTVLGSLRVEFPANSFPSRRDREIVRLFVIQGVIAILNAEYTVELVKLKNNSEESIKAKTGFLANLSHEIRGPLGLILNGVELVEDGLCGDINEDQREMLQMARNNGAHLLDLMNDVLDYAKATCGKSTPEPEVLEVNELLKDMVGVVRAQAEAKRHHLRLVQTQEPLYFLCDKRHSRQILINLLTNAIKYTPEGGAIELWADRASQGHIRISVKDTGVGIAEGEREKVFAAFERVDEQYSKNQNGTGLGMPLTKSLVELNGGSIDFASRPREGSHFWLLFKGESAPEETAAPESEDVTSVDGAGAGVLFVGKSLQDLQVIKRYLTHYGFKLQEASSEAELKQLVGTAEKISLVLLDESYVIDKIGSTLQVLRDIIGGDSGLPVVVLSSDAFAVDIEKYLKAGVDRCLIKPVDLRELGLICMQLTEPPKTLPDKQKSVPGYSFNF